MSALFLDSFDHYDDLDLKWDAATLGQYIDQTVSEGRFTAGALKIGAGGLGSSIRTKNLTASEEMIAGFAWMNTGDVYDGLFYFGTDGSSQNYALSIDNVTGIATLTADTGATCATASATFTGSIWQHVEMRVKVHNSLGELEIRRNGISVASITGVDTLSGTDDTISSFRVRDQSGNQDHYIDDLYIFNGEGTSNNTFAGDSRVTVLRPSANGGTNDFTPTGAATNYETQNETIHDGDSTYVEAGQIGAAEDYDNESFADLGISPSTIFAVQTVNSAQKTDAGTLQYKDEMVIAGVRYDNGTEITASSGAYKMTSFVSDTDPSDSATWTEAKVEAVGSGFTITFREI